jgi:hypothetical protein
MQTASVKQLKDELKHKNQSELMELCLQLSKFKKENKELLTYLLFEASDEETFRKEVKAEMDEAFVDINRSHLYFVKKASQKILRQTKKYIRYSKNKETEMDLMIHYLRQLRTAADNVFRNPIIKNIYNRESERLGKTLEALHEDIQMDYRDAVEEIQEY